MDKPKEKFEYVLEYMNAAGTKISDILNMRGADGWELVNVSPAGTLIFKRRYVE